MEVSGALVVHFLKATMSIRLKNKFSVPALKVKHCPKWVIRVDVPTARKIFKMVKKKSGTRSNPSEKSMFARSHDPALKGIANEEV